MSENRTKMVPLRFFRGSIFQIFEITFDNEFRLKKFKKSESSHFQTKLQILPEN